MEARVPGFISHLLHSLCVVFLPEEHESYVNGLFRTKGKLRYLIMHAMAWHRLLSSAFELQLGSSQQLHPIHVPAGVSIIKRI